MDDSQQSLLTLLSHALFGKAFPAGNLDVTSILEEARLHAVLPIVYFSLRDRAGTSAELDENQELLYRVLSNNFQVEHDHEILHEWMTEAGIPYVILKGCASAAYYPVPIYRTMGDVDFLVPESSLEDAGKALEKKGLSPWKEKHISHIVFRKGRMHLEMHFQLAGMPEGLPGKLIREYFQDVFSCAELHTTGNGQMLVPSAFHHGLVLLLHTCHHLTGEGIGLRHLCDWAVFENSFSEEEFRELFESRLRQVGLWRFAQILTQMSIRYLGAEPRKWAELEESDELLEALMQDILSSGNFGTKDRNRSQQAYLISSRGKNGVGKTNSLTQFVCSMNNVVYTRWKFARKWKVVLPVGWCIFGGRHLFRILTGKRKTVHFKELVSGADARRNLYSQLKVYECGDLNT